jgi:hypothetical protein
VVWVVVVVVVAVVEAADEDEVVVALVLEGAGELEAGVLEAAPIAPATVNMGRKL